MAEIFLNYWWVVLIVVCLVLYKYILRFLFGMVIVPEDQQRKTEAGRHRIAEQFA